MSEERSDEPQDLAAINVSILVIYFILFAYFSKKLCKIAIFCYPS